jgi:3D (Asp-Asp-Asp) domain-containing protein
MMNGVKMIKKYNIAINISFWIIIISIISVVILSFTMPQLKIGSYLFGEGKAQENQADTVKEPVVVTKYVQVEKNVEWFYFVATGYSKGDAMQGTTGVTATGKNVTEGIIAVDPKIIPYGTKVEIKDLGEFVAEDSGGKIKGNRIDIFFNSKEEAKEFGKKGVWVRYLDGKMELAENNLGS